MGKPLIIVESSAKAKTISKFLKNKYKIQASMGHLRDLPKTKFGVDFENNFEPRYVTDRKKSKIIKKLRESAKKADEVYLAPDPDREGEAIAWHLTKILKKQIKKKPVHRITFNAITKSTVQKAIREPREIDFDKVNAQQARRILDRIVGYKISPMLWRVITKGLSAGRVQSVALRLICEREEEIEKFVEEEYWSIHGKFHHDDLPPFEAKLVKFDGDKIEAGNEKAAQTIIDAIKSGDYTLSKLKKKKRKVHPSPAFITSTLQQTAAGKLYFSGKKTMMVAQQLYEGIDIGGETVGLITYMRTDSLRVVPEALGACRKLISERFGKEHVHSKTRVFKNKNSAQDAHEAIRPTAVFKTPESIRSYLTKDQHRLYKLIWERFVATQMKPVLLEKVTAEITSNNALFKTNGSIVLDKGFMRVYPHKNIKLGEVIDKGYKEKLELTADDVYGEQHFTKPPARYSEASLVKILEKEGIGRPSTYAMITNTILTRKYVKLFKKRFHPTKLGRTVNKFLVSSFDELFNVSFTADMEDELDKVEYGKQDWHEVLQKNYDLLLKLMDNVDIKKSKESLIEKTDIKCEKCGSPMAIRWSRRGQFLGCTNFPKCKNIKNFKRKDNGEIEVIEPKTLDEECPKCGNNLVEKTGRYGKFYACSNYPKCKFTKPYTLGIKCPKCGKGEITEKKNKKGRYFYSCSCYPDCDFITNNRPKKVKCPECGNDYMEEKQTKKDGKHLVCPKCKKKVF